MHLCGFFNGLCQWIMQNAYARSFKIWDGTEMYTLAIMPCTDSDSIACFGSLCSVFAPHSVATSERDVGFVGVCFKSSLHAFSDIPAWWNKLFVAISVQWQGFRRLVTSSGPFTYDVSTLSDKVAKQTSQKTLSYSHTSDTRSSWMYPV